MTRSIGVALVLLLCVASGLAQDLPRATAEHGAFGFSDRSGTRLLVTSGVSQPEQLETALCGGTRRVSIEFTHQQEGGGGRETVGNFDLLAGDVFRLTGDTIDPGETCFLARAVLLSAATMLPAEALSESSKCGPDVPKRLASVRRRSVVNCWPIARLPGGKVAVLAEFARDGKNALASIVVLDRGREIFADYPAEFRGERQDLWRVDDEGTLSPEGFRVVFLLQRESVYTLGVSWSGGEGESLAVFVSISGSAFQKVLSDYWYQAPV